MIKGKNITVKLDNYAVAAAKDCSLELSTKMQEVASSTTGTMTEYVPGRTTWNVSISGLVFLSASIVSGLDVSNMINGMIGTVTPYTLLFSVGTKKYQGSAYLTKLQMTGKVSGIATWSAKFQGSGTLALYTPPSPPGGGSIV